MHPTATASYSVEVKHDGKVYEIQLTDIEIPTCQSCGERVLGNDVDEAVTRELRKKLNLLSPQQIRGRLQELGLSQKEVAHELGVAEATLSRWMTGSVIQSRALDRFLRTYLALPKVRTLLKAKLQAPDFGLGTLEEGEAVLPSAMRDSRQSGHAT